MATEDAATLDPYQLMAALGKRVIHPGGKRSTEELFRLAEIRPDDRVLEVGCGVGTTAIETARRFGPSVTAVDIDERILDAARRSVSYAGVGDRVEVMRADIQQLPVEDESFDRVIVEAVTMFVDRERATREVVRVCKRDGRLADPEFVWRKSPTAEARRIFVGEVCPGISFESPEDWRSLYEAAGLRDVELVTGPFAMMTPAGFVRDEGWNTLHVLGTALTQSAYRSRLWWLMRKMLPAMRFLGYVVLAGTRG